MLPDIIIVLLLLLLLPRPNAVPLCSVCCALESPFVCFVLGYC